LHVLVMPPAFNLSQDQTLQFNLLRLLITYINIDKKRNQTFRNEKPSQSKTTFNNKTRFLTK
jgi:hypothetical protein